MPSVTDIEVGSVQSFSYDDLMRWANIYSDGNIRQYLDTASNYGVGEEEALLQFLNQDGRGINVSRAADGSYQGWFYNNIEQMTQANPINSNATTVSRASLRQMVGNRLEQVGQTVTRHMTRFPASGGLGQRASYVLGSVGGAYAAVSTGISLGKAFWGALYQASPNFWDSLGLEGVNPEYWRSITQGDDSPYAGLFNFILGIDPDTGTSQMYMDERAYAYLAYAMAQSGLFDVTGTVESIPPSAPNPNIAGLIPFDYGYGTTHGGYNGMGYDTNAIMYSDRPVASMMYTNTGRTSGCVVLASEQQFSYCRPADFNHLPFFPSGNWQSTSPITKNGKTYYYAYLGYGNKRDGSVEFSSLKVGTGSCGYGYQKENIAYLMLYAGQESGIEGITDQPNATLPDISDWTSPDDTLASLQRQYPDTFSNPMVWDNDQPDGTHSQIRYVPIPIPNSDTGTNTQPTSGNQTQTSTQISPTTIPAEMLDQLTRLIQAPQTQPETQTQPQTPPANPIDTGSGGTTTPAAPVGNASALWSVYHPTQAQVNSFGGWLWGSPFLTNIGKLFENPIDGVITLHKIYAPPVDSGNGTIVVGTLDSQVPSATVNQQYVTVDCGSVSCQEDFGNVFDYPPFTKVHLYLPFVGIVPLDVNDVMRATIHVVYGVDVFTGACIAMVEVTRDGNTINMYQYTGNCAVHYPLSNVQQSQLLSGLISVAAGVGSIVATGGASVPAVAGIVHGAATAGNTSIGRSGGFSANAGAMGIKKPYIIIQRPQTKVAEQFTTLAGYPTNISGKLSDFSGQVNVTYVHVNGIPATREELELIKSLLKEGVEV